MRIVNPIIIAVLLVLLACLLSISTGYGKYSIGVEDEDQHFVLPQWGGAMVHSDSQLRDFINLSVPKDDVSIVWHSSILESERHGAKGNGVAGNGNIAACTFGTFLESDMTDTLVIYDFNGSILWKSRSLLNHKAFISTPMVDIHNRVIACDDELVLLVDPLDGDNDSVIVEWISEIEYGGIPLSPIIVENTTVILATDGGPLYAYDALTGLYLSHMFLGEGEIIGPYYDLSDQSLDELPSTPGTVGDDVLLHSAYWNQKDMNNPLHIGPRCIETYFSTINSACVKGNRVYIATQYKVQGIGTLLHRLYAVDVDPTAGTPEEVLTVAWYFDYEGVSQASPTFIDGTVYFDGYQPGPDHDVYAVTDLGDDYHVNWTVQYPNPTLYSFSYDPRGGFWYLDGSLRKLVRFSTDDGRIIQELTMDDLVQEPGIYFPSSVMTICGTKANPIMLVSATRFDFNCYVLAIDLAAGNTVVWKVETDSFEFGEFLSIPNGQYTILRDPGVHRIVFGTYWDGVMAIGVDDGDQTLQSPCIQHSSINP